MTTPSLNDWAADWVRERGVAPPGPLAERTLTGGISSTVVAVDGPTGGVVVKRALDLLRVDTEWRADPRRSLTEAQALVALGAITPNRVPRIIDVDSKSNTLVMERAPLEAENWRTSILDRHADSAIGAELGNTLAAWHRGTRMPWREARNFESREVFEQLRLRPFHVTVAARFPELAIRVLGCAEELRQASVCLVHGDLSPKNVLVGRDTLWIIDPEVAHIGDPVFDVAFMASHLILAALARPQFAGSLGDTWGAFVHRYLAVAPSPSMIERLDAHIGCLLLARTDGISKEPGLGTEAIDKARLIGRIMLEPHNGDVDNIWDLVRDVAF